MRTTIGDLMTFNAARKKAKMRLEELKEFALANGLAIPWPSGGYRVSWPELELALVSRRVDAKGRVTRVRAAQGRRQSFPVTKNSDVRC
jgi:hypothetical protein